MEACLRRFCQRLRTATVWSQYHAFKVTSPILMCQACKLVVPMSSPCIRKIPKAKVNLSLYMPSLSKKLKSTPLDQHIDLIRGKFFLYRNPVHITLVFEEYSVVQIHPAVISDGESNMCMSITSYSLMIENTDNCKLHIKT